MALRLSGPAGFSGDADQAPRAERPHALETRSNRVQTVCILGNQLSPELIDESLPNFGVYEDMVAKGEPHLFHSVLSSSLNLGCSRRPDA